MVPLWYAHRYLKALHLSAQVLPMSDAPVLKALDLYREEAC